MTALKIIEIKYLSVIFLIIRRVVFRRIHGFHLMINVIREVIVSETSLLPNKIIRFSIDLNKGGSHFCFLVLCEYNHF